jgi:hypothetical protein
VSEETALQRVIRERLEREAKEAAGVAEPPSAAPVPAHDADLIPDVGTAERSAADREIDRMIGGIGILDAYAKWSGKGFTPRIVGSQRESIKIRCPLPSHPDKDPSAWVNLDKDTWFCGGCEAGGDKFDIAARGLGFPVPGYQEGANFVRLRERMVEDYFGKVVKKVGDIAVVETIETVDYDPHGSEASAPAPVPGSSPDHQPEPPPETPSVTPEPPAPVPAGSPTDPGPEPEPGVASIHEIVPDHDDAWGIKSLGAPALAWESLFAENTFLYRWCAENTKHNDIPDEFFAMGTGPMALSMIAGRRAYLLSGDDKILGNHFVCMMGHTGTGKSRAIGQLKKLLRAAAPFDKDSYADDGVLIVPPSSPEALQDAFLKEFEDPSTEKKFQVPVRGLVSWNEMSEIVAIARREGNVLVPKLLDLYDGVPLTNNTRSHGLRTVEEPFGSLVTTTQSRAIRLLFQENDLISGFLNRWWFVAGPDKEPIAFDHSTRIDGATAALINVNEWIEHDLTAATQGAIRLSPDARASFETWYKTELYPMKIDPLYGRVDHAARKIMLLLTLNNREMQVTTDTVQRTRIIVDYLIESYKLMRGQIGQGPARDCIERIKTIVTEYEAKNGKGKFPSRRYIWRMTGTRFDPMLFERVMKFLINQGVLEEHTVRASNGRAVLTYEWGS